MMLCLRRPNPNRIAVDACTKNMAAIAALLFACVCKTRVTSTSPHSGQRPTAASQLVQPPARSIKQAISARVFSSIGTFTSDTEKAMLAEKMVMSKTKIQAIAKMNTLIAISFCRFLCTLRIENDFMDHPNMALKKNRPEVSKYTGPIQAASESDSVFKADEPEKEKMPPRTAQPIIGRLIQAGTLDSRLFCTSGLDMMLSSVLTTSSSCLYGMQRVSPGRQLDDIKNVLKQCSTYQCN